MDGAHVQLQLVFKTKPLSTNRAIKILLSHYLYGTWGATAVKGVVTSGGVFVERHHLDEAETTQRAHIGPLVGVNADMTVEVGDVGEAFAAHFTGIGAHTLMNCRHVAVVLVPLVEPLAAHLSRGGVLGNCSNLHTSKQ